MPYLDAVPRPATPPREAPLDLAPGQVPGCGLGVPSLASETSDPPTERVSCALPPSSEASEPGGVSGAPPLATEASEPALVHRGVPLRGPLPCHSSPVVADAGDKQQCSFCQRWRASQHFPKRSATVRPQPHLLLHFSFESLATVTCGKSM